MALTSDESVQGFANAPRWIALLTGTYCMVDLFVLYFWSAGSQPFSIQGSPDSASGFSVIAMAGVGFYLSLSVWRRFQKGACLRPAWMLMALSAAAQAMAGIVEASRASKFAGHILGGPIRLALLAISLWMVLRVLRQFGFWTRPSALDWAVAGLMCLFTLCRLADGGMADPAAVTALPILCVLVWEAMLLRRSVLRMGSGPIAKCWAAFGCGILLTAAGEMALWVVPRFSHALPAAMIASLTQFPTAAIFALGPTYQLMAQSRPKGPAAKVQDHFKPVPVLAR